MVLIGGSYGIGAALAEMLEQKGANVHVLSRTVSNHGKHIPFDASTDVVYNSKTCLSTK